MSIIYEALKKVEPKVQNSNKTNSNYRKDKPFSLRYTVLYILTLCLGISVAATLSFLFTHSLEKTTTIKKYNHIHIDRPPATSPIITTNAPILLESQSESKQKIINTIKPSLVLNGIFFSENEGYALINNKILKEGDSIEQAKVKSITPQKVELEFEGETIILYVK
ncbi:MAG: general secretion pathway protein GspB [Candidatus Omnitrophica bacterium]|nr:general secretion pathway protein GspB [Candidatus Omnitrophota bacterium]